MTPNPKTIANSITIAVLRYNAPGFGPKAEAARAELNARGLPFHDPAVIADEDQPLKLRGTLDISVSFVIHDIVELVKKYPKEWLAITPERLREEGYEEWERFHVFLFDYLDSLVVIDIYGDKFTTFTTDWDDTEYRWTEAEAEELMKRLPRDLQWLDENEVDTSLIPGPNDVPLPGFANA